MVMAEVPTFQFNLDEQFPHLPSGPVVEAIVNWRGLKTNELFQRARPQAGFFLRGGWAHTLKF
jgi:hypothetical protein